MKKVGENRLILGLYIVFTFIICLVVLKNIGALNSITIISDEFGYWYAGSVFAGINWREVAYLNPYYGFGYGFLLCPLFWLFDDAVLMYRVAIGYNAIFMILSFILGVKVMDKLDFDLRKEWKLLISFAVTMYSNLVFQSQTTQVECLLNCLFWMTLYCIINIVQQQRYRDYISMALVCGYMYAVHMRSLGVVISSVAIVIFFACTHKGVWKRTMVYLGVLLVLLLTVEGVKAEIKSYAYAPLSEYRSEEERSVEALDAELETQNNVEELSDMSNVNDYSSVMGSFQMLFSIEGLQKLFVHLCGKIYYLLAASLLLVFYAGVMMFQSICKGVKNVCNKQETPVLFWVSLYLVMALLFAIGVASAFLLDYSRQDMIVYGRYSEYVIGPLLLIGLYMLVKKNISIKLFYIAAIVEVVLAFIVQNAINAAGLKEYLDNNAVGLVSKIVYLYGDLGNKEFAVAILAFVFLEAFAVWLLFKVKQSVGSVLAIALCAIVWFTGGDAVYQHNTVKQQTRLMDTVALADYLKMNADREMIYYVDEPVSYTTIDYIQFQLPRRSVKVVKPDELEGKIKPGYYLLNSDSKLFREEGDRYIGECKHFVLYHFTE